MSLRLFTPPESASHPFLSFKTRSVCSGNLTCSGLPVRGPPCWSGTRGSSTHHRCQHTPGPGQVPPLGATSAPTGLAWPDHGAVVTPEGSSHWQKSPPPGPGRAQAQSPSSVTIAPRTQTLLASGPYGALLFPGLDSGLVHSPPLVSISTTHSEKGSELP